MKTEECFKKINIKLSRIDLTEFKKISIHEEDEFNIEIWSDTILAWMGSFHKPENNRRLSALEKTVSVGGTTWYEYYKSCEALIDVYNKKQTLRLFADKLFSIEEPTKEIAIEVKPRLSAVPDLRKQVEDACESLKSVFEESPNSITGVSYFIYEN